MNTIRTGYDSDEVSFNNGLAYLHPLLSDLSDEAVASALRCAAAEAACGNDDAEFLNEFNELSQAALLLYEIMILLTKIGR